MTLSENVCQDCGNVLEENEGVKVTNEGWLCNLCCGELVKGNDVY